MLIFVGETEALFRGAFDEIYNAFVGQKFVVYDVIYSAFDRQYKFGNVDITLDFLFLHTDIVGEIEIIEAFTADEFFGIVHYAFKEVKGKIFILFADQSYNIKRVAVNAHA